MLFPILPLYLDSSCPTKQTNTNIHRFKRVFLNCQSEAKLRAISIWWLCLECYFHISANFLFWQLSPGLPVDRMLLEMLTLFSGLRAQSTMHFQLFIGKLMPPWPLTGRLWMLRTVKERKKNVNLKMGESER